MASIIPKIKVGLAATKRQKLNLSFDCSTTSNIGNVQPTMCREMVPNSKFKVKVSSLVRLASMPTPTFGRMSLRHYHVFVPYVDLWQPFDAMMSGQHYHGERAAVNQNFIPTKVPFFTMADLIPFIVSYSDISIAPASDLNKPYTIGLTNVSTIDGTVFNYGEGTDYATEEAAIRAAQAHDLTIINTAWQAVRSGTNIFGGAKSLSYLFEYRPANNTSDDFGSLNLGTFSGHVRGQSSTALSIAYDGVSNPNVFMTVGSTPITPEGADLITKVGDYYLLIKFRPEVKRLRTIFIGLGYQFSPYNTEELSALKLFAYYKAWFNLFSPIREKSFVDTTCYLMIKRCSEANGGNISSYGDPDRFKNFLHELAYECYYYLPMDYYSMSVIRPQNSNQDTSFVMNSGALKIANTSGSYSGDHTSDNVTVNQPVTAGITTQSASVTYVSNISSPLTLKLAFQMLKWANKNTVLGRSIREYLKVHFGVDDTNAIDDGGVYRIGSSRTNINISDVMSTAENEQGYLGEYGGKGIGFSESESFDFTTDKFGVWITLTCVVPESGYYQGYLKENRHLNRYQFFNPEFDALGYQVLERGEVMDDYSCDSDEWNPKTGYARTAAFGLVPRYSEYKVGRNIVNGDISLVGLRASMSPYTIDRRLSTGMLVPTNINSNGEVSYKIGKPNFVPSVVYDAFRRIDPTDHLGQYNRIFNYGGNDLDHFIINNIFDVKCYAPMKPLSESFDTIDEGEHTIDVTHS